MSLPENLKYSEEHVWVSPEGKRVRLGLTDFAQSELGDIVFVELPMEGDELKSGEPFGSVESVKSVTELYSPVTGTVREINRALADLPGRVNLAPFESWIAVVELSKPEEMEQLMSAEKYAETYGIGAEEEEA